MSVAARAALVALLLPGALTAQVAVSAPLRELAAGVTYRHALEPRGPWRVHMVQVDLRRANVELRAARADDQLRGRERTSAMVQRASASGSSVLVAVNADFFNVVSGENENNQVVGGEWWKGLKVTDSPYDTFDNTHAQFAMDAHGRPTIGRFVLDARAWMNGTMTPLVTVNANPSGAPEGAALYTPRFGAFTPRDSTRATAEGALTLGGRRGDTAIYVRKGAAATTSGSQIPRDGAVIAGYGARTADIQAMRDGDTVRVVLTTVPHMPDGGAPTMLIGGWPQIVRDGRNVAADASTTEGTISRNAEARHPRTAIGYSKDRKKLWLYVVDGRSVASVGMTLTELADELLRLGAWDAMNFDGGGSSTMVIDGAVVNVPSDPAGERPVGNALLVVRKRRNP